MQHLLVTRFNLNYGDAYPYSDAWMVDRMELFERFCLPSVRRQTCRDFTWLVYFDRQRTAPHRARLEAMLAGPGIEAVHVDSPDQMIADLRGRGGAQPLLTSRLDNDDALHPRFVERLQDRARALLAEGAVPVAIDAPLATWWERGTLRARQYRSDIVTPFASVLEVPGPDGWEGGPWGAGPRTVLVARHENLGARLGRVETLDEALCLTVLHGKNVSNGRGRFGWVGQWLRRWRTRHEHLPRAAVRRLLEDFGLGEAA